jgi:hypothetical protein
VPRPLALLLAAVALAVVAWALVVPPLQVPDEQAHYGYVQSLAESHRRPPEQSRDRPRVFSTEEEAAARHSRAFTIIQNRELKPPWSTRADARWRAAARALRGPDRANVRNIGTQAVNPPLYYLYEAIPYELASGGDFFSRLYAMRLFSGLLMLVTAAAGWLLVGELTGRDPLLQLAGATVVGLQPMTVFISSGVNPDAAFDALLGLVLWLSVRTLVRGLAWPRVVGLVGALVTAALVKPSAVMFLPAVAFALLLPAWRARRTVGAGGRRLAIAVVACALVVGVALAASHGVGNHVDHPFPTGFGQVRSFAGYLEQFYLPRLPFVHRFTQLHEWPAYAVWLKTSWAAFGWLEVRFPDAVYVLFAALSLAAFGGAAVALRRRSFSAPGAVLAFFAIALVGLLLGLHWLEYREFVTGRYGIRVQGRYLLPLMPVAGAAVAAALTNLRPPGRAVGAGVVVGAMVVLQLLSLALVAARFYA